ncbi:MAG: VWA-like domain-containing protein, partial [Blastocatellia bacterium]
DWRKQLGSLVRNAISYSSGAVDYSYQRPSRRQSAFSNIVIPGMRKPNIELAVVIDTSGSMSEDAISQVLTEVEAILKISGQTSGVRVIACDSDVHFNKKVFKKSQVQVLGGGGTDMCMGIEAALKTKPRPQVIIVITDGDSPWPCKQLKNTQLIVALTEYTYQQAIPKWAKFILLDE